ncbi:OLC1v1015212C1 [Oldenlandia corymbosa var. corymbosa]|uniref:OLC1v1015212C1 n=1 Tax=Oldenlandia corymbosa var. corymbosa TaxID=529605 RepID=A0AAV1E4Y4_OLDCO|nr:OLC1v1015212C1 [Oldenlandia corymbosa var. corymbosa]
MATEKKPNGKSKKNSKPHDVESLKSDVASFASSIGLSSSTDAAAAAFSGFNDSDFRKKAPVKPFNKKATEANPNNKKTTTPASTNPQINKPKPAKPGPGPSFNALTDSSNNRNDKWKNLPKLPLVRAHDLGSWYVDAAELEEKVLANKDKKVVIKNLDEWKNLVEKKKELGERLLSQYAGDYESSRGKNGDIKMLMATQRSGTAADKVSAFSVMVGDNAVANLRSLDVLLGMVTSKFGKRHALTAFEVLKELFISSLLPDRKLKTLFQQPLNLLSETKDGYSLLLFWYFEDCLKERYKRFVSAVEEASRDVLAILKDKAVKAIYVLLKSKPEQERLLLSALVNKLGDPGKKVASNADFHLSKLLTDHPSMKAVVIEEVDKFLFRPHLGLQAKFYAVNFLAQIRLSHRGDGPKVAKRLVDVYFALFKILISNSNGESGKDSKEKHPKASSSKKIKADTPSESHVEMDSRLLTALLTGVNRAFPFVSNDESEEIIAVQTPILFQLVHSKSFNVGVQALVLLDKISSRNQIVSDRFYRALYSKLLLPAAMNSSKEEMFIGLLLRAMKNDINLKRVAAFAKRLLQVALQQPPQYACGCLFLLSEVLKARPPLWNMMLQNELIDEDLEHFEDAADEDDAYELAHTKSNASSVADDKNSLPRVDGSSASEVGRDDNEGASKATNLGSALPGGYDLKKREPLYCNADRTSWWELTVLASHVHPSVATMARTLLSGANIVYNGNPLVDLSLTAFLNKFMEKKPKQTTWHGGSDIEPAKKLDMNNQLIGAEILSLAESDVPPEDFVFHKFYSNKLTSSHKSKKKKKKKTEEDEDAEELVGDDQSDDEEIENVLNASNPPVESDDEEYDYDDLDNVANDDDDDLIGRASDEEMDFPSSEIVGKDFDFDDGDEDDDNHDDNNGEETAVFGEEEDDEIDDEEDNSSKKRKRKGKKSSDKHSSVSASPFASIEEYEHLIIEDDNPKGKNKKKKKASSPNNDKTKEPKKTKKKRRKSSE